MGLTYRNLHLKGPLKASEKMKLDDVIDQLIADAPVDEIPQVLEDLKKISSSNINAIISDSLVRYNLENNVVVQSSKGGVILSKYNQLEGSTDKFIDYAKGITVTVDHVKLKVVDEESSDSDELCVALESELQRYVDDKYPNEVDVLVTPDVIIVVGSKSNVANFWSSRWRSVYDFDGATLRGKISVDVHYYEDGNVRFLGEHSVEESTDDPVKTIGSAEDIVERDLQRTISQLNDQHFKQLRRQLPVTRAKVQWGNAIGNYRLGKDVAK